MKGKGLLIKGTGISGRFRLKASSAGAAGVSGRSSEHVFGATGTLGKSPDHGITSFGVGDSFFPGPGKGGPKAKGPFQFLLKQPL
ncbi:MAG TPA: hypothetical protein DDW50_01585 [Firmicutes bacterium]|nr:hypothetical protein [Bacillota bacterium]